MTNPAVWKPTPLSSGLGYMDEGIIFPGQCHSKGKKERKKSFLVQFRYVVLIQTGVEAAYPGVNYLSSSSVWFRGLPCMYRTRCQVEPSLAVRCVPKPQCLLVLQLCRWSGALGKVLSNGAWGLFSSDDVSRILHHWAPNGDQQDPLNWDLGMLL